MYSRTGLRSISLKCCRGGEARASRGWPGHALRALRPEWEMGKSEGGWNTEIQRRKRVAVFFQIPEAAGTRQFVIGCL